MSDDHNNPVGWFEIYVQDMRRAKAGRRSRDTDALQGQRLVDGRRPGAGSQRLAR